MKNKKNFLIMIGIFTVALAAITILLPQAQNFAQAATAWLINGSNLYTDSTVKVGIGSAAPTAKLYVEGDGAANAQIKVKGTDATKGSSIFAVNNLDNTFMMGKGGSSNNSGDSAITAGNGWISNNDNTPIYIYNYVNQSGLTNSQKVAITILGNRNVGIGTTNPANKLEVVGNQLIKPDATWSSGDNAYLYLGDPSHYIKGSYSGRGEFKSYWGIDLSTQSGTKLTVLDNGNVGIGTATPGAKLDVAGNVLVSGSLSATTFSASTYSCTSDSRYKKDITPITDSLSKVLALEGVSYQWRQQDFPDKNFPSGTQVGLIAQDVEKVVPELVSTDSNGYKTLNYNGVSALLINAIKDLQAENQELKAELEAVKSKLD